MYGNAYNIYKNNSVNYASKEQLLLMLVDGAVKFAKIAREGLANKDVNKSHDNLVKVQNIFTELIVSLDKDSGEWADQLLGVYIFIKDKLVQANITKNVEYLDEVLPLIDEVKNIWHEAYEVSKAVK